MMQRLRFFSLLLLLATGLHGSPRPAVAQGTAAVARPIARPGGEERALLVYPNPSTGIVHVSINGFEGRKIELSVLNVIGTVMYRETLSELNDRYTRTLDLSKFANGLYYVKLESDNTSEMRKLVIR
ncbi:T9SS type A sorting domain-containing protein [Hymenobacter pini]|uniref:T9SS type A sorting domain-containing protein n=1 Tax=Hymenobacter pini TaxID=2880879 RepID=UPI001CF12C27|nr:T9SS type A sorting domain-containing protein [Hymenobacter pini]MCA8832073.1 T9SS type A sorting domain-containing protein [Hymenobacter pini]